MKMVKSLLLGTAAGFVAVAGAQAADMPVKAKPVQYVKICSLYGDGFYYIPGTDTCLKLGGYLRVQAEYNMGGGGVALGNGAAEAAQARINRADTNDINFRTRAALSWDVRQQTEYGTLRTYIRIGVQQTTPADVEGGVVFWDRAFMQFAGFTVGKTQSFFDLFTYGGAYSYHNVRTSGDTGAAGVTVWAYTAQFGNGFSGTLSLESLTGHNRAQAVHAVVDNTVPGFFGLNGAILGDNAFALNPTNGFRMPEIVANLRVDQAWGFAGISAALHEVGGAYYSPPGVPATVGAPTFGVLAPGANLVNSGHPADKIGWAFAAGAKFNLPGGDMIGFNACYSEGAAGFCTNQGSCADLQFLEQRGRGLDRRRRVRYRHRGRADPGVECSCRVRAHLEPEVADLMVRRLCRCELQRCGQEPDQRIVYGAWAGDMRRTRNRSGKYRRLRGGRPGDRQQLQPELQLLRNRDTYAVEPGGAARYRSRTALHQAQHRL